ncbi:copia protein, partial [Tanacetum coccineum]
AMRAFEQKTRELDVEFIQVKSSRLVTGVYAVTNFNEELRNMMGEVDIDTLTIEQYLMLTQGNQAQGMYEAEMKRQTWRNARSYFPTNRDTYSLNHDRSRVLGYEHHFDDSKINAYYDLPPSLPYFKPIQPHTEDTYEPLEENTNVVSKDESETGEQRMIIDTNDDKPFSPNPQHNDEELSLDEDLDRWLKAEMEKRMCGQDKESEENALIDILKSLLPLKELNPGSFTLPCTIGNLNLYAMADLGASVNVMPKSIFEHLKLASLKETSMIVEMADITKKALLGIVENILIKIDKFLFPSDFVIIDMLRDSNETMILGRPFLATIHAQIDVFKIEILLGIGEDKVKFNMDGGISYSRILVEKIYMASSIHEEEYFNPFEIENDVFSY